MSRKNIVLMIAVLSAQASILSAENTFVQTTYDDPNWVLVASEVELRANFCLEDWYEKVFNPCYNWNRYWELAPSAATGRAFPMSTIKAGIYSLDGLYVAEGFGFQLYDGSTGEPCSPYLGGARYVSLDHWFSVGPSRFLPYALSLLRSYVLSSWWFILVFF